MQNQRNERRGNFRPRPPFRRHRNRHPGLVERQGPKEIPTPTNAIPEAFASSVFGQLNPLIQHAVAAEEYETPTPIQEKAIPSLLEGRDLLGCAQTGTGKTAAFLLPILHRLAANPKEVRIGHPRALILAPTRELAAQIATSVTTYGRFLGTPFAVVFGGVSQYPQVQALKNGAVLVVATPGRLLDLMDQRHIDLDAIEEFVLDEADRMLDMGFMPDIKKILSRLPVERHSQFFSATLSPEVLRLAMSMVKNPVHVTIEPDKPTVDRINQQLVFVDKPNKDALLIHLLKTRPEMNKVIVFARTRHGSDKIVRKLEQADIAAEAIHSDKSQKMRTEALRAFKNGHVRVLVATDIASRGIDVDNITHVVNFDLPEETESYVHRIGRTARAGAEGAAFSFVSAEERGLLKAIERMIKKSITVERVDEFHSERAEKAAGRGVPDTLPRPEWAGKKKQIFGNRQPRRDDAFSGPKRPKGTGRRQADYGRRGGDDVTGNDAPRRDAQPPSEPRRKPFREGGPADAPYHREMKPSRKPRPDSSEEPPRREEYLRDRTETSPSRFNDRKQTRSTGDASRPQAESSTKKSPFSRFFKKKPR